MKVNLYVNNSDSSHLDKSLSSAGSYSGTLKENCTVVDPSIILKYNGSPSHINYMQIPEFGRYYYITNWTSIAQGLWMVSGHTDVLMSFRDQIRQNSGIITRQEYLWDLYLDDDRFLIRAPRQFENISFPGRMGNATGFILTVAGGP